MIIVWITSVIIWIAYAYFDSRFSKRVDYHFASALFTVLASFLLPFTLLFTKTELLTMPLEDIWDLLLLLLKVCTIPFVILSIKWTVFDLARNKFMGHGWFYYGKVQTVVPQLKNGAMDKGLGLWQFPLKAACLIVSIILSIIY